MLTLFIASEKTWRTGKQGEGGFRYGTRGCAQSHCDISRAAATAEVCHTSKTIHSQDVLTNASYKKRGEHILQMMESTERRKNIENEMLELVVRMHIAMGELEEMMLAGYRGREDEVAASLQANT